MFYHLKKYLVQVVYTVSSLVFLSLKKLINQDNFTQIEIYMLICLTAVKNKQLLTATSKSYL
jgi:hypothetical protein